MSRHFLIDTDTGSDDAVALVMAMQYPGVEIEAITVVAGNVPVDQAVQNALYTVELCQQAIPVYRGMPGAADTLARNRPVCAWSGWYGRHRPASHRTSARCRARSQCDD